MRYLGSKYRLLPFIENVIQEVTNGKFNTFADLFAGTGIIGKTYREKDCYVTSNDVQYYSYILNKHYIQNKKGNEGIIPVETIKRIMSKYGKYKMFSTQYRRFKLNKGLFQPKHTIEFLHCLIILTMETAFIY